MGNNSHDIVNTRLSSFLDGLDKSYSDISEETGIPRRTLYDITKEGNSIKHAYIFKLCEKYHLDPNWLFNIADSRTNGSQANTAKDDRVAFKSSKTSTDIDEDEFYTVPFYPNVKASAGAGLIPDEGKPPLQIAFRKYYINKKLHCTAGDLVAIKVEGDSMAPTLQDDDIILVDQSKRQPRSGKMLVIRIDDTINCKRIQELPGHRLKVMSDNQAYESFEIDAEEPNFDIIGTIVWYARDIA